MFLGLSLTAMLMEEERRRSRRAAEREEREIEGSRVAEEEKRYTCEFTNLPLPTFFCLFLVQAVQSLVSLA